MDNMIFVEEDNIYKSINEYLSHVNNAILSIKGLRYSMDIKRGSIDDKSYSSEVEINLFNGMKYFETIDFFIVFEGKINITLEETKKYILDMILESLQGGEK